MNTYTAYTPQSFVCKKQIINENYLIIIKLLDFLKCYAHIYIYFIWFENDTMYKNKHAFIG